MDETKLELVRMPKGNGNVATWHGLAEREDGLTYTLCGLIGRTKDTQIRLEAFVGGKPTSRMRLCQLCGRVLNGKEFPRYASEQGGWVGRVTGAGKVEFDNSPRGEQTTRRAVRNSKVTDLITPPERLAKKGATFKLPVIIQRTEGGYLAYSPSVRNCEAIGPTLQEVLQNVAVALEDKLAAGD